MIDWWDKQIRRADLLAAQASGAKELLAFYAQLLRAQKEIYEFLQSRKDWLPSGDMERDLPVIREAWPVLLKRVKAYGPEILAAEAHDLICATCLSSWQFRRVVCVNCGEERPAKLGYFHTPEYDHIRIEACDTCKHYIKGVDLTRLGFAVPLVDEVAAAPLDVWARAHGYAKIELN